jgi:predicted  nucleic acid-binding Zn-ribbon protein
MTTLKRNIKEKDSLLKQGQEEIEKLKQELKDKDTEIKKLINKPKKTMAALEIQIQKLED